MINSLPQWLPVQLFQYFLSLSESVLVERSMLTVFESSSALIAQREKKEEKKKKKVWVKEARLSEYVCRQTLFESGLHAQYVSVQKTTV